MTLGSQAIAAVLRDGLKNKPGGVSIVPSIDPATLKDSIESSLTFRLGRWFATIRESRKTHFHVYKSEDEAGLSDADEKSDFVPFGSNFVLHPGRFVLGVTMEWISFPETICGKVSGKSYVGRRGLIIETAPGIHPGFSGCLTLEMANVGEAPIVLRPGMPICQVYLESIAAPKQSKKKSASGAELTSSEAQSGLGGRESGFAARRKPTLGPSKPDKILDRLSVSPDIIADPTDSDPDTLRLPGI